MTIFTAGCVVAAAAVEVLGAAAAVAAAAAEAADHRRSTNDGQRGPALLGPIRTRPPDQQMIPLKRAQGAPKIALRRALKRAQRALREQHRREH